MIFPILKSAILVTALAAVSLPAKASNLLGSGVPQPAFDKAQELENQGHDVRKVVFIPGGGWVVIYDTNGFYAQGTPVDAIDKLNAVAATEYELKTIAFTPQRGWVILYGFNGYWYQNVPTGLADKLAQSSTDGYEFTDAVITSTGAWALVGKNGFAWYYGLHSSLATKITELSQSSATFTGIAVSPLDESDWLVLLADGYWYNNLEQGFVDKLAELYNDGIFARSFTYANGGQGLLVW